MKGIKLTPLNMFILLVLVLIISIWLGYSVHEGATGMGSTMKLGDAPSREVKQSTFKPYSDRALVTIVDGDSTTNEGKILYDPVYGNMINVFSQNGGDSAFVVINRKGSGTKYDSTDGASSDVKQDLIEMQNIGQLAESNDGSSNNFAWSYDHFGHTVIYVSWDKKTIIYLIDNVGGQMKQVFHSNFFNADHYQTNIDNSIMNMPLPTSQSNVIPATSQKRVMVEGVMAYQVSDSVFFNFEKGIFVKTHDGYNVSHNSNYANGSIMEYDNLNNSSVASTKFMKGNDPAAVLIIITNAGKKDGKTVYQLNTTVRVMDNSRKSFSGGNDIIGGNGGIYHPKHHHYHNGEFPEEGSDSPYILKTEIVPPVCPMCPSYVPPCQQQSPDVAPTPTPPAPTPSPPTPTPPAPTPSYAPSPSQGEQIANGLSGAFQQTVKSTGDVIDQTVQTTGNVLGQTVQTTGNVLNTGLGTAGGAVQDVTQGIEGTATGLGKDVSNIITGLGKDVTGLGTQAIQRTGDLAQQTVGSATGLTSQAMGTAAGLAYGAGSGAYSLAEQAMYRDPYGNYYNQYGQPMPYYGQYGMTSTQQSIYPGAPVYPTSPYSGYGTCNMQPPMPMQPQYDPMPVTNDFSQFT
jgi:hypothetical protein